MSRGSTQGGKQGTHREFVWPLGEVGMVSVLLSHVVAPRRLHHSYLQAVTELWGMEIAQIILPDYQD